MSKILRDLYKINKNLVLKNFKENCSDLARFQPDEANMDTEAAVDSRAVDAEEDPIRHGSPCRILRVAVKAHLN